jgi:hypothetical protein
LHVDLTLKNPSPQPSTNRGEGYNPVWVVYADYDKAADSKMRQRIRFKGYSIIGPEDTAARSFIWTTVKLINLGKERETSGYGEKHRI